MEVVASCVIGVTALGWAATSSSAAGPRVAEAQYGFSFSLPTGWHQVPLDGSDVSTLISQAAKHVPGLENALSNQVQQATAQGVKVFAVGPSAGTTVPTLNIQVQSSAGVPTGIEFVKEAELQGKLALAQIGAKQIQASAPRLPLGQVVEMSYVLPLTGSSVASVSGEQIYIAHKAHFYILTFTSSKISDDRSAVRVVANSWRWK